MEILTTVPDELFSDSIPLESPTTSTLVDCSIYEDADQPSVDVLDDIIDDVIFGFSLEIHRMAKKKILLLDETDPSAAEEFKIVETPGHDIFGQEFKKKTLECVCPNCGRNMAASRFAPHLEKCMGMGRCSSRVASRRIATNVTKQDESDNDSFFCDDNDDSWGAYKSRTKKIKRDKHNNSPRGRGRPPKQTARETAAGAAGELTCQAVLDNMTESGRRTLLQNICGTIIDSNVNKLCTRTVKCSLHTEDQRNAARHFILVENKSSTNAEDEVHIDIDTYDDLDSQALRDALWDRDMTPTASPADSTSTINSSGSRKRGGRKGRSKDR